DTRVRVGEAEVRPLVLDVVALELVVALRNLLDRHPPPDLPPEVKGGELLLLHERPPAEARVPADRLVDERRQDVEEVLVRDLEPAVQMVHAPDRAPAVLRLV